MSSTTLLPTPTRNLTSGEYREEPCKHCYREKLKQLQPRKFYWKSNEDKTLVDGFIAHEVSGVVPEAITGEKDATNEDGSIKPQQIDQSKLIPLLTSALQEAITKIETLESRVQTLENA